MDLFRIASRVAAGENQGDTQEGDAEFEALERAKVADVVVIPEDMPGTNCASCQFLSQSQENYCSHPKLDQPLPAPAERVCCAYWNNPEATRPYGKQVIGQD